MQSENKIREALEAAKHYIAARSINGNKGFNATLNKIDDVLAALASEGQESGEPVEQVARMIARGLGHNDETGMHWERYVLPARIIVREFRATPPQESAALPQSTQEGMGWQPIETAPKDGTVLVTVVPTEINEAFINWKPTTHPAYIDDEGSVCDVGSWKPDPGLNGKMWRSTHWMPLPPPAVSSHSQEEGKGDE